MVSYIWSVLSSYLFNTSRILAFVLSTPNPDTNGIPVIRGTPKSLFTFDVVTIRSAGRFDAISEILTCAISISMLFSFANSTIAFAAIVDVATAPPHATITFFFILFFDDFDDFFCIFCFD